MTGSFTRLSADEDGELARLAAIKMQSPLEILLFGGDAVGLLLTLLKRVADVRLSWFQGTEEKYEAEGFQLDNEAKRRAVRLEVDRAIESQAVKELSAGLGETGLLDQVETPELPLGLPESRERNKLVDVLRIALELPVEVAGVSEDTGDPAGEEE